MSSDADFVTVVVVVTDHHKFFVRGKIDLCNEMRRTRIKSASSQVASLPQGGAQQDSTDNATSSSPVSESILVPGMLHDSVANVSQFGIISRDFHRDPAVARRPPPDPGDWLDKLEAMFPTSRGVAIGDAASWENMLEPRPIRPSMALPSNQRIGSSSSSEADETSLDSFHRKRCE